MAQASSDGGDGGGEGSQGGTRASEDNREQALEEGRSLFENLNRLFAQDPDMYA